MKAACLAIGFLWAAIAGAETTYRLPWGDGLSFTLTQAPGGTITTHFTKATVHAIDIAMPIGIAIVAARSGIVEATEDHHGASPEEEPLTYEGNFVRVRHVDGTAATYAHLKHRTVAVALGQAVEAGQWLGYSGASGDVQEPHLHFAVTRVIRNSTGWQEEISMPVTLYVGLPPTPFAPRAAMRITANYSTAMEVPRTASAGAPSASWKRRALGFAEEAGAWCLLLAWLACGIAGFVWFWKFSRDSQ